ncbi:hypothetical protein BdWA1_002753 [Babesia duncani]|uniref:Sfi1 spindle body domain-containing protein n=1 Tax=Babesia duncani TaxID=323732 RepID=A0AAD9PKQ0_9APIC|nr:hypothetical protein BdWA1_002753 [Babesia duncani]
MQFQCNIENLASNVGKEYALLFWVFATRAAFTLKAGRAWCMSRALSALRNAKNHTKWLCNKRIELEQWLRRRRLNVALSNMFDIIYKRQRFAKACNSITTILSNNRKRILVQVLYTNSRRETELVEFEENVNARYKLRLLGLGTRSIFMYTNHKREARRLTNLVHSKYRLQLLSKVLMGFYDLYQQRILDFDARIAKFQSASRRIYLRGYWNKYKRAVQRSMELKTLHDRIKIMSYTNMARACFQGLQLSYAQVNDRRMELLKQVLGPYSNGFGLTLLSEPSNTECICFVYLLLGMKLKAQALMANSMIEPLDFIVRLTKEMSADDLRQIQQSKSSQLYGMAARVASQHDSIPNVDVKVPDWVKYMLRSRFQDMASNLCGSVGLNKDYKSCRFIPLWRCVNACLLKRRAAEIIRAWKEIADKKRMWRLQFENLQSQLSASRALNILRMCFGAWMERSSMARIERFGLYNKSVENLCNVITALIKKRKMFVLLLLSNSDRTQTAISRLEAARRNLRIAKKSCNEDALLELYRSYANTKLLYSCMYKWLYHYRWAKKARAAANVFYRNNFLTKGWNYLVQGYAKCIESREAAFAKISSNSVRRSLKRYFDGWYYDVIATTFDRKRLLRRGLCALGRPSRLERQCNAIQDWNNDRKLANFIEAWSTAARVRQLCRAIGIVYQRARLVKVRIGFAILRDNSAMHVKFNDIKKMKIFGALRRMANPQGTDITIGIRALIFNVRYVHFMRWKNRTIATACLLYWKNKSMENACKIRRFSIIDPIEYGRPFAVLNAESNMQLLKKMLNKWHGSILLDPRLTEMFIAFIKGRRVAEGLLAFWEHAMEKKWHALCKVRCEMLYDQSVHALKLKIYRWWRIHTYRHHGADGE